MVHVLLSMAAVLLEPRRGPFKLGDWVVQPTRNRIERDRVVVLVRPKAMDVLAALAARPGAVVAKETLLDTVWPGQPTSDSVLSRAIFELREALSDQAQQPRYIETVARRGYRLAAAVTDLDGNPDTPKPDAAEPRLELEPRRRWRPGLAPVAAAALVLLGLGAWSGSSPKADLSPVHATTVPRVAVLPFENLGEPSDEYLSVGMAEEISSRLAGLRAMQVVACSAESRRLTARGVEETGRRLRVDYVVSGAVRWDHRANRVRVTPRVVRIADGAQVWADTFDRDATDLLGVQGEIASSVGGRLPVVIQQHELATLQHAPTANPDAYRAYLEGRWHARRSRSSGEGLRLAVRLQERATGLDPAFAEAWAELGRDHANLYHLGSDLEPEQCRQASSAVATAVALAPRRPHVLLASALVSYWCDKDFDGALARLEETKRLRADLSEVWEAEAWVRRRQGRWQESIVGFKAALDLSPQDPLLLGELGSTLVLVRRYQDALAAFEQASSCDPDNPGPWLAQAEVHWQVGDLPAARAVLARTPHDDTDAVRSMWAIHEMLEGHPEAALERLGPAGSRDEGTVSSTVSYLALRGDILTQLGRQSEAREAYLRALRAAGMDADCRSASDNVSREVGTVLARLGRTEAARHMVERLVGAQGESPDAVNHCFDREQAARVLVALGEHDRAAGLVAELLQEPSALTPQLLALDPAWKPLRSHPRLAALISARS